MSQRTQGNEEKPEWVRVSDAVRMFGLSRSSLYELISTDAIKSISVHGEGAVRGVRLINFDSLAAYIESFVGKEGGAK
jgi:hypothetical protein